MKPKERYEKYKGDKIRDLIYKFCCSNPNKYKYGCYYCPIWGSCGQPKTKKEIEQILLSKGTAGPVVWEKHIDLFLANINKTSKEIDLEIKDQKTHKAGWRDF